MSPCFPNALRQRCDPVPGCNPLRHHPRFVLMANVTAKAHRLGMMTPCLPKPLTRGSILDKRREKLGTMEIRVRPRVQRPPLLRRLSPLPLSLLHSRLPDALGVRVDQLPISAVLGSLPISYFAYSAACFRYPRSVHYRRSTTRLSQPSSYRLFSHFPYYPLYPSALKSINYPPPPTI